MTDKLREEIEEKISEILLRSFDWPDDQDEARRDIVSEIYDRCITRARAAALEEAAKVAETMYKYDPDDLNYEHYAGEEIAAAIRALSKRDDGQG